MYRVIQALNNNVALVKNEHNKEAIVTGLGLAFQKKKGEVVVESKIEKVFQLRSEESKENFLSLLKGVPLDFITVTYDVINRLTKQYHYPVQEYLYVTLTDHIYCSYKAIKKNTYLNNELPDISNKYQTEYKMAQEALESFRSCLLEEFPDNEIGRIALHFINAKGVPVTETTDKLEKEKGIFNLIELELRKNGIRRTNQNSIFYDRFMTHLNYFLDYLDRSLEEHKPLLDMEEQLKIAYPEAYAIGSSIYDIVACETGVKLYRSERFYLVIHIQRLL
ncbi:PRD domain-containing protein [Enterococcus faecalis]|uniref:PRD domain-containing protein n=1 Tax=Enterococcus faecalis TaxID=1351 RepID=UPI000459F18A|nr:PRD domain-containing protein [Enterococcus faecalis]KAJ86941.1 Beta-glucoside bgl operon antiterminator, BglG family [Enterococcus faecalis NY9]